MYIVGIVERKKNSFVHVYEHRENKRMRKRREEGVRGGESCVCVCVCVSVDINARPSSSYFIIPRPERHTHNFIKLCRN